MKSFAPKIFKDENYYPDLTKGMAMSDQMLRDDNPIEINYAHSLAYQCYTEDMSEPQPQMKNMLPLAVIKFKQENPSVFDPSIFSRVYVECVLCIGLMVKFTILIMF